MTYTAIICEARYGDTVHDTKAKLKFNTISDLLDWFSGQNPDKKRVYFADEGRGISVSILTNSWGSVYMYTLQEVSTNEGIVYRKKTWVSDGPVIPLHVSENMKKEILDYKQKFEKEKPLVS